MTNNQKISSAVLAVLLIAAGTSWWITAPPSPRTIQRRAAAITSAALVDESTYSTALQLAQLPAAPEEQTYAATALRVADHELSLAFNAALRDVETHPPAMSPEAVKIRDRLQKSQKLLEGDQQRVIQLTAAVAQAPAPQKDALQDELDLAQSMLDLDKDEVAESGQDLLAAGGNPQQRIETLVQEHEAQVKTLAAVTPNPAAINPAAPAAGGAFQGSLFRFRDWLKLRRKVQQLADAEHNAGQKTATLVSQRTALASSLDETKGGIAELAQHTKSAKDGTVAAPPVATQPVVHSHEDAAALLDKTKLITADQKLLTLLDRQTEDQRQLAGVYQRWGEVVSLQAKALLHELLLDAEVICFILLALVLLDQWLQRLLNNPKLDRRQIETLRSITRVALRVVAVLVILLIVIGVPGQFGTMIGIVGAGLTVAMKDFIVAFFGWLILMGRNGIRLGDWVEINGVSGEVTQLGMFHTVLLETGNWSDAGHPTGRRVTFTNSFAIEKHYFNFSTSGQWLWDELQVVVPAGQDPYPLVHAITKKVVEATAESARLAEQEWRKSVPDQPGRTFSGAPGVSVKPVVGGIEIGVRYLTRAHERFLLRAQLYQSAVDLMGAKTA